jgi:hypothetical protein
MTHRDRVDEKLTKAVRKWEGTTDLTAEQRRKRSSFCRALARRKRVPNDFENEPPEVRH